MRLANDLKRKIELMPALFMKIILFVSKMTARWISRYLCNIQFLMKNSLRMLMEVVQTILFTMKLNLH